MLPLVNFKNLAVQVGRLVGGRIDARASNQFFHRDLAATVNAQFPPKKLRCPDAIPAKQPRQECYLLFLGVFRGRFQ